MNKVHISSPWVSYYRELQALFGADPDISVIYDEDNNVVKLYVDGQDKADALSQLLPAEKDFGNVTLVIEIIPDNSEPTLLSLYKKAFNGNPIVSYIVTVDDIMTNPFSYIVFKNKVVQYFNDELGDINGNKNTLYQEIAKNVFDLKQGIFFCTDTEQNLGGTNNEIK